MQILTLMTTFLFALIVIWHDAVSVPVEVIDRGRTICEEHSGLKEIGAGELFKVTLPYTIVCENGLVVELKEGK